MKIGGVCSGVGMLERAVQNAFGGEIVWHSEIDTHASKVLAAHSDIPNHGDLTQTDWKQVEPVDVFCAGFPCQDMSIAGRKAGVNLGAKSSLWWQIADGPLSQMRPSVVVLENVPTIVNGRDDDDSGNEAAGRVDRTAGVPVGRTWLGAVLGSLADLGYVGRWGCVRAADAGAPHLRTRWFCIATQQDAPTPVGGLSPAPTLRGHLLPTPTAMQPGGNVDAFLSRKIAAGIGNEDDGAHVTDLRMMLDCVERDYDGWGPYAPAVERWQNVTGREAPPISQRPRVHEWMMGWPDGWCTDFASGNEALRMCGNGVVPQQAELALRLLCR